MDNSRINKLANCSQCSLLFAIRDPLRPRGNRCPLILPCGHSVCEQCVRSSLHTSNGVVCATCGSKAPLSQADIMRKEIPINMYLLGCFVDNYSTKERVDSKIAFQPAGNNLKAGKKIKGDGLKPGLVTEICSECTTLPAVWKCTQCAVFYCNQCFVKVHKAAKALQKHSRIQLGMDVHAPVFINPRCNEHPEQKLEFHCKECDIVTCPMCIIKEHSKHAYWTIQERNEAVLPDVKEAYDKANIVLKRLIRTQKDVKNVSSDVSKKMVTGDAVVPTQRAVSRHFVHLHGVLQLLEASILGQLEEASSGVIRNLENLSQELDTHIEKVKRLLDEAVTVCDLSNLPQSDVVKVLGKLLATEEIPCHLLIEEPTDNVQIKFSVDDSILEHLNTHCKLDVPKSKKYSLVQTNDLPEDFRLDSIEESTPVSELSNGSRTSSVSALSDIELSDSSSVASSTQQLNLGLPAKGYTELVTVSHIKDPSSFYVLRESEKRSLENLTKQLHQYVLRGAKPPAAILQDGLYIVQFNADKKWYRARVKKIISPASDYSEEKIEVLYIDYGNTEVVTSSRLRCINPKHTVIPPYAQHCGIFGITPNGGKWSHQSIKTMAQMLDGWRVIMTVMGYCGGVCLVDLSRFPGDKDSDVPMSIRDAMIFLEHGCFVDSTVSSLQNIPVDKHYLGPETLQKGLVYEVEVTHINSPGSFYVQKLGSHAQYRSSVMEDMNQTYSVNDRRGMIYTPAVGMPCAAQHSMNKKWFRAKILALPGQRNVQVFYVDIGEKDVVSWTAIRKLYDRFLRISPQAIHCTLNDVLPNVGNEWSANAKRDFFTITMSKQLMLFVDEVLKTNVRVTLYESQATVDICLNAMLVKLGHAISTGSSSGLVEYRKIGAPVQNEDPKKGNNSKSLVAVPKHSSKKKTTKAKAKNSIRSSKSSSSDDVEVQVLETIPCTNPDSTTAPEPEPEPEVADESGFRLEVAVLAAVNPSCIYVSLVSQQDIMDNLMLELQAYYNRSDPYYNNDYEDLVQSWGVNDKCCAFNETEQKWYRGIITEIGNGFAKVFLKDFAVVENIPLTDLQPLAPQFMEVRDGAVKCHLAGVKAAGDKAEWPTLACEQLSEIINHYDSFYISKKGEIENFSLPIELWIKDVIPGGPLEPTVEQWYTVNMKLVDQGLAIPVRSVCGSENVPSCEVLRELQEQNQDTGPVLLPDCPVADKVSDGSPPASPTGCPENERDEDNCEDSGDALSDWLPALPITKTKFTGIPTYVDDDCFIYLHEIASDDTLTIIQKALQCRLQNSQPKPHDLYWFAGQLCIAQYHDKNWYRGRVLEVYDDLSVRVLFVDYGNVEDLKATDMRKNVYMGHIPIQCTKYKLDGVLPVSDTGKWPTPVLDFVHSTIVEKKCNITVKHNPGDGSPPLISVTAPGYLDLAKLLVNMRYATFINKDLQMKADEVLPMFTVKLANVANVANVVSEIDQDSDSASLIIEEDGEKQRLEDFNVHEEGNHKTSEVSEEGNEELVTCEERHDEELGDVTQEIVDADCLGSETGLGIVQKGTVSKDSAIPTDSDEEKCKVLPGRDLSVADSVIHDSIKEETLVQGEESGSDSPVQNVEVLVGEEILLASPRKEENAEGREYKTENMKENSSTEEKEMPVLWSDCLSEDGSEQSEVISLQIEEKPLHYRTLDINDYDEVLVEVSAIITPTEVVIRPVECEENVQLIKDFLLMSARMQEEAKFQEPICKAYVGMPCCVCYKEDGQWYRATVLSVESLTSRLKIQYVDYGNVEDIDLHEAHVMRDEWMKVPVQGIPCQLWRVKVSSNFDPMELVEKTMDCFFQPCLRAKIKSKQPRLTIELFSQDSNTPVYQTLIDEGVLMIEIM